MSAPATTVITRYRQPEELARLAEALHDSAMHIAEECSLSFADVRAPLPSPEEIVRRGGV